VRLAGIEPTTPWFVAKYSIQLSYSRSGKTKVYHRYVPRHTASGLALVACDPTVAKEVGNIPTSNAMSFKRRV